jgi:hypothetical protein
MSKDFEHVPSSKVREILGLRDASVISDAGLSVGKIEFRCGDETCERDEADSVRLTIYPSDVNGIPTNDSSAVIDYDFGRFIVDGKALRTGEGVQKAIKDLFPEGALSISAGKTEKSNISRDDGR